MCVRRTPGVMSPLVCAQRILRHIIPGVAYINDRNWDLLCLSSAREILRADLLSLPLATPSSLGRYRTSLREYSRDSNEISLTNDINA